MRFRCTGPDGLVGCGRVGGFDGSNFAWAAPREGEDMQSLHPAICPTCFKLDMDRKRKRTRMLERRAVMKMRQGFGPDGEDPFRGFR